MESGGNPEIGLYRVEFDILLLKAMTHPHILDFDFKMDSNIHNDTKLVVHAASKAATIKTMNKVFYFQTIDGGDNISFNFK